jgi:hypothetical protein
MPVLIRMIHKQILEKISAKALTQAMEDDLVRLTFWAMCEYKNGESEKLLSYVLPKLMIRWNCVLEADLNVSEVYKQKAQLSLAVLLNKYGFSVPEITENAIKAIDELNRGVVLSDSFERRSDEIKELLLSEPRPLKRKPSVPASTTFYRANEAISIQIGKKYYVAFIHRIIDNNSGAIIEIYDAVFDKIPRLEQLEGLKAKGRHYNDGSTRISLFWVAGMKFLPDPANQIHIIGSNLKEKPINRHLEEAISAYAMSDLFRIQEIIHDMFKG